MYNNTGRGICFGNFSWQNSESCQRGSEGEGFRLLMKLGHPWAGPDLVNNWLKWQHPSLVVVSPPESLELATTQTQPKPPSSLRVQAMFQAWPPTGPLQGERVFAASCYEHLCLQNTLCEGWCIYRCEGVQEEIQNWFPVGPTYKLKFE